MTTTASRFLSIGYSDQNINTGFTIRVLDYKDMKTPVAIISEWQAMSFTQELNGVGTGSITFDEDDPSWGTLLTNGKTRRALLDNEYVFEILDLQVPRFSWVGQTVENGIGDDETRTVTISGPGIAQVLTWATIHRPGWPVKVPIIGYKPSQAKPSKPYPIYRAQSSTDTLSAFNWRFPMGWPTMRMWWTVFKAAQRRGLLGFVNPMFTALKDSGRKPWQAVKTVDEIALQEGYQPETPSENLLDFLNDCTGQDYSKWFGQRLEWVMHPGFKLDVRPTIGEDRSKTCRFFQGQVVTTSRTRDREAIYNRIIAVDVDGNETNVTDAASVARWNLREQRNETNKNITDTKMRGQLAERYRQQTKDEKDQFSVVIPYDGSGHVPYRAFYIGDLIGFNLDFSGWVATAVSTPKAYRVMAITLSMSSDSVVPECELTLKSLIDSKMDALTKQITDLLNNPRNIDLSKLKDIDKLKKGAEAPADGTTLVYNGATGKYEPGTVVATDTGGGGSGSASMYIQKADPAKVTGNTVHPGDFWLETYD